MAADSCRAREFSALQGLYSGQAVTEYFHVSVAADGVFECVLDCDQFGLQNCLDGDGFCVLVFRDFLCCCLTKSDAVSVLVSSMRPLLVQR